MKAPFVWFGGKRRVAKWAWDVMGDVDNYVEPFAGSLAVLLERPSWHEGRTETVNDADNYLANFWRALQADPEAVAHYADWPVNETDLFARHLWLVNEGRAQLKAGLESDPEWFDAKIAGWWVWGINSWIGSGWCSGTGPWMAEEGVVSKLPHLGNSGRGVNRQLPHLGSRGADKPGPMNHIPLYGYFDALAERLRRVRVCCGDWSRVVTNGALAYGNTVGVFLDPPYGDVRTADLYATDDLTIAADVGRWCRENEANPRYRIVLCGYEGEHEMPGWDVIEYSAIGGLPDDERRRGEPGEPPQGAAVAESDVPPTGVAGAATDGPHGQRGGGMTTAKALAQMDRHVAHCPYIALQWIHHLYRGTAMPTKVLNIRGVEDRVSRKFAAGAAVRGITQAEYLDKLLRLRERVSFFCNQTRLMDLPPAVLEFNKELMRILLELGMMDETA